MQFHIENMTCGGCARSVTKAIQSVDPQAEVVERVVMQGLAIGHQQHGGSNGRSDECAACRHEDQGGAEAREATRQTSHAGDEHGEDEGQQAVVIKRKRHGPCLSPCR